MTLTCEQCHQSFANLNATERRDHRRKCTISANDVYYPDLDTKEENWTMVTIYRGNDKRFRCIRCYKRYPDATVFQIHAYKCKKILNVHAEKGPRAQISPALPTPPGSSLVLSALGVTPPTLSFTPPPSSPPPQGLSVTSTLPLLPLPRSPFPLPALFPLPGSSVPLQPSPLPVQAVTYSLPSSSSSSTPSTSSSSSSAYPMGGSSGFNFNLIPPFPPAPLAPPMSALPRATQDVALPLLEALASLASTCPLCWLRSLDNQHNLYVCPNITPKKLATSDDVMFQVFKTLVDCPVNLSYCYGCLFPVTFTFDMESGKSLRFHGKGYGRKNCRFTDALLPVLYYVYGHRRLRGMLNMYGILGFDFTSITQIDYARWLVTTAPSGHLPPPLLVLHTMINAFGMPPPPASNNN